MEQPVKNEDESECPSRMDNVMYHNPRGCCKVRQNLFYSKNIQKIKKQYCANNVGAATKNKNDKRQFCVNTVNTAIKTGKKIKGS